MNIEGTNEYPYRSNIKLNASEHYWTTSWAVDNAKSWIDKIPLPKRHAKIYNEIGRAHVLNSSHS